MTAMAVGVCLALASAAAGDYVHVPVQRFTLAWTHSIEKVRWEEDYEARAAGNGRTTPQLVIVAARIRGSGAGMEPPADAVLRNGWYEYRPASPLQDELLFARSAFVADYEFCAAGQCRPMQTLLKSDGGVTRMFACRGGKAPG